MSIVFPSIEIIKQVCLMPQVEKQNLTSAPIVQ